MKKVFLTIDLDMVNYTDREWDFFDEMDFAFAPVYDVLDRLGVPATWFVRIDKQIAEVYGDSRYLFTQHARELARLRESGHQLGWHYHAYRRCDGKWVQNLDEAQICDELLRYGEQAMHEGLRMSRMGWGYHTQATMECIDGMGISADSSAIPRPAYPWTMTLCNWERTGQAPYHPSRNDFQTESPCRAENLRLLEIPMTTAVVHAPSDEQQVVRYINAAYKHEVFWKAVNSIADANACVLILHPYECVPQNNAAHALLSFDIGQMESNLRCLLEKGACFAVLNEFCEDAGDENT